MSAYYILQVITLVLLAGATAYIFVFAAAGIFYKQQLYKNDGVSRKIAVLIPGYKEDEVIAEAAANALQQNYPTDNFDVIVIADSFQPETLTALQQLPVTVIEVAFEKSTKSKALNKAMSLLSNKYDIAVVLDADNLMSAGFLEKVNNAFAGGCIAVQGHRAAKNINNSWAILDAVSEEINNNIFRKGHRRLGLSSAIIGSGMAFQYEYFKSLMSTVTAVGGFDKEIELKMLKEGKTIHYLDDALVLDEKIQKSDAFGNQRRRWLSAQLHYFRKYFTNALKHLLLKGNVDYFDKAVQFIQPPRILLLGAVLAAGTGFIATNTILQVYHQLSGVWICVFTLCIVSLAFSTPAKFYNTKTILALSSLPKGMFLMLLSLLKIKGANKTFIHTKHSANITAK